MAMEVIAKEDKIRNDLLNSGILYLHGKIDDRMASDFGKAMIWLNNKRWHEYHRKEIVLYIDSYGGAIHAAMSIYDMIYCSPVPVTGIVYRQAYSAAAVILQACHERVAMQNADLLFHPCIFDMVEFHHIDEEEMKSSLRLPRERENSIKRIVAVRSGKSEEDAWAFIKEERYISAEEALALGFVDRVIYSIPEKS